MTNFGRSSWSPLLVGCGLLLLAGIAGRGTSQSPKPEPTLKLAKYAELGDLVRQQRGKVVVVDFWADY
jgi:hypothetical protein